MKLTELVKNENALSPVIGVILMVAITVILAAVIGAFVLGIGPGGEPAPTVSWDNTENTNSSGTVGFEFQHGGGEDVQLDNVEVSVQGAGTAALTDEVLRSGDTIIVNDSVNDVDATLTGDPDGEARIRWVDDGESTPLTSESPTDQWATGVSDPEIEVDA